MWYYINKFSFLTSITLDIWILLFERHSFLKYKLLQCFFGQVVKFHWKSEWLFSNRLKKEGVFIQITHEKAQLLIELIIFARLKSTSFKLILILLMTVFVWGHVKTPYFVNKQLYTSFYMNTVTALFTKLSLS